MSLDALGVAANIFGVISPAKDVFDILKGIADSVESARRNKGSIAFWEETLRDHVNTIDLLLRHCIKEEADQIQLQALFELLTSFKVLRKELLAVKSASNVGFFNGLFISGDVANKIKVLKEKVKQCQSKFMINTLASQTATLTVIKSQIDRMSERDGQNRHSEQLTIMWKDPGKDCVSDPLVMEYACLRRKARTLISVLNSKGHLIQEMPAKCLLENDNKKFIPLFFPLGNPLRDCEDTSHKTVVLCRMLQDDNLENCLTDWLQDLRQLGISLYDVGLRKEAFRVHEYSCNFWISAASRAQSPFIFGNLASSLYSSATCFINEGQYPEAVSNLDKAVKIFRRLGEPYLLQLGKSLLALATCLRRSRLRDADALESVKEGVLIYRKLARDDIRKYGSGFVRSLSNQSRLLRTLSRYEEALQFSSEEMQQITSLSTQYEQDFPVESAAAYWNKAKIYRALGDLVRAKEYGDKAMTVSYRLIRGRPKYYSYALASTVTFSSWFDCERALPVIEESLPVCLSVDVTFTAPYLAGILECRADALYRSNQFGKALDPYEQAIEVHRRLIDDGEDESSEHLMSLLKAFRRRGSCLISLGRQRDAVASLDAAQDAIVVRLKNRIEKSVADLIIQEVEEQHNVLANLISSDCSDLISSLQSHKKVLATIDEIRHDSRNGRITRLDLEILLTMQRRISLIAACLGI